MKAREIFNRAVSLIGERDSDGNLSDDIGDYKNNAVDLLNTLISMVWPSECILRNIHTDSFRYVPPNISSLDDEVALHLSLCHGVIPFGLAYLFLLDEDLARANVFYKLFTEAESKLVYRLMKAKRQRITDVYS